MILQSGGPLTNRRAWGMWNAHAAFGNDGGSPKMVIPCRVQRSQRDHSKTSLAHGTVRRMGRLFGSLSVMDYYQAPLARIFCVNSNYLGSIGYLKSGNTVPALVGVGYGSRSVDCLEFKDVVFYAAGSSQRPIDASGFDGGSGA